MRNSRFDRFLELARRGRKNELNSPPLGFSARVAAICARRGEDDVLLIWERFARWAAAAALVVCLIAAGLGKRAPQHDALAEFAGIEPETEWLW
ncbi:MAG: hypothetical protein L0Z50_14120 [Verrucomicrobiales bacterium]|nr:hypothetical protein [Verrucomicrobiales bacterium]